MLSMRAFLLALSLSVLSAAAHADIYSYTDANGDVHFATEKLDARYELFARGDHALHTELLTPLTELSEPEASTESESPLAHFLSQHPNLQKYEKLLNDVANDFNLDPALLKAVVTVESSFNPKVVSPKGAVGLMQVMPATAERFGLHADRKKSVRQKLTDPETNIRIGARYLSFLRDMFPHQQQLVVASYNAGEGAVQKYNNAIPPYQETRNYVKLVTQFYKMFQPATQADAPTSDEPIFLNQPDSKRVHLIIPGRRNISVESITSIE